MYCTKYEGVLMVFEVDFWGHGIEVHFDGEETPIAIYGGDRGFAIRTWTYPNHPDGDDMLSIFDNFDMEEGDFVHDPEAGLLLELEDLNTKDWHSGRCF